MTDAERTVEAIAAAAIRRGLGWEDICRALAKKEIVVDTDELKARVLRGNVLRYARKPT